MTPSIWSIRRLHRPDGQPLVFHRLGHRPDRRHHLRHAADRSSRGWANTPGKCRRPFRHADTRRPSDLGDESRGLKFAAFGLVAVLIGLGFLTRFLPEAPLRNPETGALIGNSPFMNGLIAVIMVCFLVTGAAYGFGAGTMKNTHGYHQGHGEGPGGTRQPHPPPLHPQPVHRLFQLQQHRNDPGRLDGRRVEVAPAFRRWCCCSAFIVVVSLIDLLITGAIAKWALFAPIFVPLLLQLNVAPEAVLAAYRHRGFADERHHPAQRLLRAGRRVSRRNTTRKRASERSSR
jgi:hypothetical protein